MWTMGKMKVGKRTVRYEVKHFDEGSIYGIHEGRISKLWFRFDDGEEVNYDREWDIRPKTADAKEVLRQLLKKFN